MTDSLLNEDIQSVRQTIISAYECGMLTFAKQSERPKRERMKINCTAKKCVRNGHDDTTEISRFVDILVCFVPCAVTCMLSSNCHTHHMTYLNLFRADSVWYYLVLFNSISCIICHHIQHRFNVARST